MVDDVAACYAALGVVRAGHRYRASSMITSHARRPTTIARCIPPWSARKVAPSKCRSAPMKCTRRPSWAWPRTGSTRKVAGAEKSFDRKITWMRQLLEQAQDGQGNELAGALDAELTEDRVYALSPKDEVLDLPQGATPLDFAYQVHPWSGTRRQGQRSHRAADLPPAQRRPRRDPDRQGGRSAPRLADAGQRLPGQQPLAREGAQLVPAGRARNAGRSRAERELAGPAARGPGCAKKFHADSVDDLYIQVALGDTGRTRSAVRCWRRSVPPASPRPHRLCRGRPRAARTRQVQVHRAGRGQPAGAAGTLLPAGGRRADRRLPDP